MIYSYSRLKRYADCPASFQYKYLYEMPELPTEPLALGKTVHTAIQLYLTGTELETAVDQAILQEAELLVDRDEVLRLVEHPMVRGIQSGQVEQQFLIPLDREGVIQLQGYIDWYEQLPSGAIKLIDWKSNRQKYAPTDNHQLGLYSWYLSQVTGAAEVDAELVFLRYPYADSRQAYTYTSVEMEEARRKKEAEEEAAREAAEEEERQRAEERKENSWGHKFLKKLKKFGQNMISEDE